MSRHDDNLQRAGHLAGPSYAQKRDSKTPAMIDSELRQASALALIEIAYSLRRIEGLLGR